MKSMTRKGSRFIYTRLVKPILFWFSPDSVHSGTIKAVRIVQATKPLRWLVHALWAEPTDPKLQRTICGVTFDNPIGIAAGFDKNGQMTPMLRAIGCGFATIGSVTCQPRPGNPRPWFYRLPNTKALIVHAGLANHGIRVVARNIRRNNPKHGSMPVFISVAVVARTANHTAKDAIDDALQTIRYIEKERLAQFIEVNISCPNAHDDQPFTKPEALEALLVAIDGLDSKLPIFVKMPSTRWEKFEKLLDVVTAHNVQGVTVANLTTRRDVELKDDLSDTIHGGMSGRPCFERSNELIAKTRAKCGKKLYIIGVGGVFSPADAKQKLDAGADLVALITGMIFTGPQLIGEINGYLKKEGT